MFNNRWLSEAMVAYGWLKERYKEGEENTVLFK